jgi:transglutaminase-like putative cysteine protease
LTGPPPHDLGGSAVGCRLVLELATPAVIAVQVAAARRPGTRLDECLDAVDDARVLTTSEISDQNGTRQHWIRAQPGTLTITYTATLSSAGIPAPEQVTDEQRSIALRPSRYCPSDRVSGFALSHFGGICAPRDRVQAIAQYVWDHISYAAATSGPDTDAVQTLLRAQGVCRDFAHLVATLCRAVGIPARIVAVYAPGLSPMDFHAVVETDIDGHWWVWDATRLAPRPTLLRIATGRDAADLAFLTVVSGQAELREMNVTAVAATDLPTDDHHVPVTLA